MHALKAWLVFAAALSVGVTGTFLPTDLVLLAAAMANFGIFAGYLFVAMFVAPELRIESARTRTGGVVFFATCGMTHLELAFHAVTQTPLTLNDFTSLYHFPVHVVQLVAVWVFVTGIYSEILGGKITWPIPLWRDE